jgi:hypothetical protein
MNRGQVGEPMYKGDAITEEFLYHLKVVTMYVEMCSY